MILIDAGPLVALFDKDDDYHSRCKKELLRVRDTLMTTWPVLTEVMYLLNFSSKAQDLCFEFLSAGGVSIDDSDAARLPRIHELMKKYRDLPMDFADASLVALSESEEISRVFTLDHKDFRIYRPRHVKSFQLIPDKL